MNTPAWTVDVTNAASPNRLARSNALIFPMVLPDMPRWRRKRWTPLPEWRLHCNGGYEPDVTNECMGRRLAWCARPVQRAANLRRRFEVDCFRNSHAAIDALVADGKMTPTMPSPMWTCDDVVS